MKKNHDNTLIRLVDDNGNVVTKNGYYDYGVGIFDNEGNEYPAGYDEAGVLFGSQIDDDNTVINSKGNRMEGFTINTAMEKGGSIKGALYQVGDTVRADESGNYIKYLDGFNLDQDATVVDVSSHKSPNRPRSFTYSIRFVDGRNPFNYVPEKILRKAESSSAAASIPLSATSASSPTTPAAFLKGLNFSALPEKTATYIQADILSDPDIELLALDNPNFVSIKTYIEQNFPAAIAAPRASSQPPMTSPHISR